MLYLQPSTEVVEKASLLLPYTYFLVEQMKYPEKTSNSGRCTPIPHLSYRCWISNKQFMLTKPKIAEGGGEGKMKWTNHPNTSVYGCNSETALCNALWSKNCNWNWKQNSRRSTKTSNKANRKLMIRSIIRTSRHTESGIRGKFFSWSLIHGAFQIRESA